MHISFYSSESGFNATVGYGQAGMGVVSSLQSLGHLVTLNNPQADLQLNFIQPIHYKFNRQDQYTIGYTPWESTELPMYWLETMNRCDEVWSTSPLISAWYKQAGVTPPIKTYQHGLHDVWKNTKVRRVDGKFKFLHIGEPAERKGGNMVIQAFINLFGDNPDYQLTIKANEMHQIRQRDMFGNFVPIFEKYPNIKLITKQMSDDELVQLMHDHHVMVYPSWGEGFGFIPLQAMATAMPTICTSAWAPYSDFITLKLESRVQDSPWPLMHPGKMFEPDMEHLQLLMLDSINSYRDHTLTALKNTTKIYEQYDWIKLTEKAFKHLT